MRAAHALVSTFVMLLTANAEAASWTTEPPLPGGGLSQPAVAVDRTGHIHVIGGYNDDTSTPLKSHYVFPGPDGGWTSGLDLPEASQGATGVTGDDGRIYYVGGFRNADLGSAYALEPDGGWTVLPDAPGVPGWAASGDVGTDGKIYVFGGEGSELGDGGADLGRPNGRTVIFDPTTGKWSSGKPMPARREMHHALRGSDGLFYVIGGSDDYDVAQNSVFVYHPATDTWTDGPPIVVAPAPDAGPDAGSGPSPYPVSVFAAAATPDRSYFVLAGGGTAYIHGAPPYFDAVLIFDVAAQKWSRFTTSLPLGRRELVAAFRGCKLSVIGGNREETVARHDAIDSLPLGPDTDGDGTPDACDCAPKDANAHPGAAETCNGIDDNCDGTIDEGFEKSCAADGGPFARGSDAGVPSSAVDGDSCGCSVVGHDASGGLLAVGAFAVATLLGRARHARRRDRSRSS